MTRNVEKGQQMSKDDLKCPKMSETPENDNKCHELPINLKRQKMG